MASYTAPRTPDAIVHTGFFTLEMKDLLTDVIHNTENGRYCGSRAGKKLRCSVLFVNPDGEIVFNLFRDAGYYGNYYNWKRTIWNKCKLDGQKIREEIAWILKIMVQEFLNKHFRGEECSVHWNRDDNTDLEDLFESFRASRSDIHRTAPITVSDAYCIYEILRGRPGIERKYSAEMIKRWRGEQRDPIMTEMEVARREQIETFKKEAVDIENQLIRERDIKISDVENGIRVEYRKKIEEVRADVERKIRELDEHLKFME